MHTEMFFGLRVLVVDELYEAQNEYLSMYHILQISDLSPDSIEAAQQHGFLFKPLMLFWLIDLPGSIDQYLQSLSKAQRKSIRRSINAFEHSDLTLTVEETLNLTTYLTWLDLYRGIVGNFEHGVLIADEQLFQINQDTLSGVFLYSQKEMIAGTILQKHPGNILISRFGVIKSSYRQLNLMRFIDYTSVQLAHTLGCSRFSLGTDGNIYGYHQSTGLYLYKKSLGLRPVSRRVIKPESPDVLQKIVNFDQFSDPCWTLSYGLNRNLRGNLFAKHPVDPTTRQDYTAPFLEDINITYVM